MAKHRMALTIMLVGLSLTGWALAASGKSKPTAASLEFLAGHWVADMWGGKFHAYYSTPEGGKVLSHSELRRDGKVAFFEFEKFEVRESVLVLDPFPGGSPAKGFVATQVAKSKVVFENPKKDYPTRIVYERKGAERLEVTLDDPHGGSEKTEVFRFKRPTAKGQSRPK